MPFRYTRIQRDDVNQQAMENHFALISFAEQFYREQLDAVVDNMEDNEGLQIICLSGPSSSGKTTTAYTLKKRFIARGRNARVISLDHFYLDESPIGEDGKPDYETVDALDVARINQCITELIETGRTTIPLFDFHTHARLAEEKEILTAGDDIIIIEGLHALNPRLTPTTGQEHITKIYVSVRSKFVSGTDELLSPKEVRLMRRMVRDVATRNTPPGKTIEMWEKVCEGERKYIDPFRDNARFKIDSTMDYEPCIFRGYLEPFFNDTSAMQARERAVLEGLWNKLGAFRTITDTTPIPADSVIREFIGERKEESEGASTL